MSEIVPLQAIPNQTLQVQLAGQATTLNVYQTAYGLFVDVYLGTSLIIGGVIAENLNRIIRSLYLGYLGDFVFEDTQGTQDPVYTGLGSRYVLRYIDQSQAATAAAETG
jgi:hypothetical protein